MPHRQPVPNLNLSNLPLQQALVDSVVDAFIDNEDALAAVLLGSLAAETGDRVSDADVVVFTTNGFHRRSERAYEAFENNKDIFYCLDGFHNDRAFFKKYIFNDMTSAEIHCLDLEEPFMLSKPFKVLFDKSDIVTSRLTDAPAPKHKDFPAYTSGDQGLIWELFDCIKWLSRDDTTLAKDYIKKLANKL
ncbi:hypothetical protein [Vibrio neptunius]|uniref:Polymerase nucleotidyl transferase domain-containing protein n=1 Tax=Vibrio neptunius TaxID=170651 RepID=A0ABS2ZY51_9VIBR|nr:hypothetical protein [Vibrio neptunius]MBN3492483.1 hypothetical protein [Vibrio neptunius]MBN3514980.1 hypothetical protein [Vibrio neptunius]MBN3548760.1 hypothetical protein [Vibrio neptunius]MBN3577108.1 hypothetical protein [Vibrio neptunius]MCH9870773.1 hypothetical protein [Vibrio neptunius]